MALKPKKKNTRVIHNFLLTNHLKRQQTNKQLKNPNALPPKPNSNRNETGSYFLNNVGCLMPNTDCHP